MTRSRFRQLGQRLAQIADPQRAAAFDGARRGLQFAGEQPQHGRLAGAVDADQPDPRTRADRPVDRRRACRGRRRPGARRCRSKTSLPSRVVAKRCSTSESRGGGSLAMSSLAAWIRNFGFDVRAGGPRRSHASSLRMRFLRRASVPGGQPHPLGTGQHIGGVAAVVGVDGTVVHLPGLGADRVEEPAVVADHDERLRTPSGAGARPASRSPRRRDGWSARRAPARRVRLSGRRPAQRGAARRRTGLRPRCRGRRRPAGARRQRGSRVRPPRCGRACRRR